MRKLKFKLINTSKDKVPIEIEMAIKLLELTKHEISFEDPSKKEVHAPEDGIAIYLEESRFLIKEVGIPNILNLIAELLTVDSES